MPVGEIAKRCLSAALIPPLRQHRMGRCQSTGKPESTAMLNMIKPSLAATIGAVALGSLGIGSATAADIPTPQYQGQYYGGPQPYGGPPPEQAYAPPPVAYGYPPPPAPPAYYEYEAPPPVIVPRPY